MKGSASAVSEAVGANDIHRKNLCIPKQERPRVARAGAARANLARVGVAGALFGRAVSGRSRNGRKPDACGLESLALAAGVGDACPKQ
jgi:hypothetical protein